ncbi:patatin family protein [Corynebacterium sp. zg-331]|uniref:patatin-like phospholipase family protein n=1 Tax=unclassified Corynebacterium TaxID=2624378 RepID=UPI00128D9BCC|nr:MULTISPECIES: patatin family protein [unclassified Corynebacterium]MBC3186119.1 patatin family protein [Corynebacterium sp. zg-331]MPV52609.1 patatin family protein [Corynebacterium sp. zg331]
MTIDAPQTALVLEGGGMRASYTAAVIDRLLAEDVRFGWVGGISAGATHTVNYLSGERERARHNFVDFASDPHFGGLSSLLRGRGYFNAEYIYGRAPSLNLPGPLDYEAIASHPADFRIGAVQAHTGRSVYWGHEDVTDSESLLAKVRASSTLPLLMPLPNIDGVPYVDGALGPSGGIPLDAAENDGYTRFFVVLTHPRGYAKAPIKRPGLLRNLLSNYPVVAERLITRHTRYNRTMARLLELEKQGRAYLFFPTGRLVASTELNPDKLQGSFDRGALQSAREWPLWRRFLEAEGA